MKDQNKTKAQLITELQEMRHHVSELKQSKTGHLSSERTGKEAEKDLHESEETFRNFIETSADLFIRLNKKGFIEYVSPRVKEFYGYEVNELVGKHLKKTTPFKEVPKTLAALKSVFQGKTLRNFQINQIIKSGQIIPMEINATPVEKNGKIVGLQGVLRDITERKQAEEKLRENDTRLRALVSSIDEIVFEFDEFGRYTNIWVTDENLLARPVDELLGSTIEDVLGHKGAKPFTEVIQRVISSGLPETIEYSLDVMGGKRWFMGRVNPIASVSGKPNRASFIARDITGHKQAEEALIESKQMLSDVFNTIPVRVFWKDLDGVYLGCNQLFALDAGKNNPDEVIGNNDYKMAWAEQAELYRSDDKYVIESGQPKINYEEPQTTPEGKTIWLNTSKIPLRDSSGAVYGVLGTYEDITQRKQAEEALRESEERFRNMFETNHAIMLLIDPTTGKIEDVNPAACKYYGYSHTIFINKLYIQNINILSDNELKTEMHKALKSKRNYFIFKHKLANGIIRDVEVYSSKTFIKGKELLYSIIHDITERKHAEKAQQESEEKYRFIVENAHDGIEITQNDRIIFANSCFAEMLGYTVDELKNVAFSQFFTEQATKDLNNRQKKREKNLPLSYQYETTFRKKDGTIIDIDVKYEIIDYNGKPATFAIIRDITERKHAEEEKAKLERQLRRAQKLETIGTLAGGIAHDFNNILTPIMGYTDMALFNLEKTHPSYIDLEHVLKGAYRAKELVEQILLFSKQSEKERQPLSLQSLVKEALKLLRPSIPSTIEIRQRIDDSCSKVRADATQIHQVIVNLCTNAWQAMEEKSGTLTIELNRKIVDTATVKLHPNLNEAEYACLSIIDTGPGMDEETLDRIFEPFFTTKSVDKGTGLGLSVVHGIVHSHKGDILVYSEPGRGSAFHVYLPTLQSEEKIAETKSKEISRGSEYIMIVDDEPTIAEMVKSMLENFGYKADVYKSGLAALNAFKQQPEKYDLLISDLTMPQMTGLDLADQLHKEHLKLPVVIMTGFGDSLTEATQKKYGIKKVIGKPIVIKELAATVRKVLDK